MSATNRGAEREDQDSYITPFWCVDRLLEAYSLPPGATVLDPCCARGELLKKIHELRPDLKLYGFEIREECREDLLKLEQAGVIHAICDFLSLEGLLPDSVDYVITNPPYSHAQAFADACAKIAKFGSVFLLRINFIGGQKRQPFTVRTRPGFLAMANRPSFDGWATDSTEYAWFIYKDPNWLGRWEMLPLTPDSDIEKANLIARAMYPHRDPKLLKEIKHSKKLEEARALIEAEVLGR